MKSTPLIPFKYDPRLVDSSFLISLALTSSIAAGASVTLSLLFLAVTLVVSTSNEVGERSKLRLISFSFKTLIVVVYSSYPIYKAFNVYIHSEHDLTLSIRYDPLTSVALPWFVCSIKTFAPIRGSPVSLLFTTPLIIAENRKEHVKNNTHKFFIN